jgi:hypothetical protein
MFPPTDNPAQRLLTILEKARPLKNQQIQKIWADVFGIENMDAPTCYRILGHLNDLVDSVEMRVKQIEGLNHELYLRDLPTIRAILCPDSITRNWHDIKRPLDTGVLTGLEFCANELCNIHHEDDVSEDELAAIKEEFSKIVDQVSKADLDPNLKLILYDLLTSALLAIDQYAILGNDGLKRSIAYTLGVLTLHKKDFIDAKEKTIVQHTMQAIKRMCDAVTLACKMKELGVSTRGLLE